MDKAMVKKTRLRKRTKKRKEKQQDEFYRDEPYQEPEPGFGHDFMSRNLERRIFGHLMNDDRD